MGTKFGTEGVDGEMGGGGRELLSRTTIPVVSTFVDVVY